MSKKSSSLYYYPNIICYIRLLFLLLTCGLIYKYPLLAIFLYFLNWVGDIVDGVVARLFNQCSRLGYGLDISIDLTSMSVGLLLMTALYPQLLLLFAAILILELMSHVLYLVVQLKSGNQSHKNIPLTAPKWLRIYYTNIHFLRFMLVGRESFTVLLLLYYFYPLKSIMILSVVAFFVLCWKQYIHYLQLKFAVTELVHLDEGPTNA